MEDKVQNGLHKTKETSSGQQLRCGLMCFHPKWMQPFVDVRVFVGLFGAVGFTSWSLYSVLVSQISNIEKAFGFTSSESGTILMAWEVGYLICTLLASYFAIKAHIPRVLGAGTLICGLSGILTALPHFFTYSEAIPATVTSVNISKETTALFCLNESAGVSDQISTSLPDTVSANTDNVSKKTVAYVIFIIAMVIQGGAKAPCYPYSSQYIDDVDKRKTGFYIGIISGIGIFGMALGYGLGSWVTQIYVTFQDVDLTTEDPRWIGAWWFAFLLVGFATLISAIPMFFFPRKLIGTLPKKEGKGQQPSGHMNVFIKQMKEMGRSVLDVLGEPLYTCALMTGTLQALSFAVFMGFEPKYMETQFTISSWKANIIIGVATIMSLSLGSPFGGYLTKRLNPRPAQCLRLILGLSITVTVLIAVNMFIGCPQQEILDPYTEYKLDPRTHSSEVPCDCTSQQFLPICGSDGQNYFSPCHAGCQNGTVNSFNSCSWIEGGTAKSGFCDSGCKMLWVYAASRLLQSIVDATSMIPIFIVLIRSVTDNEKSLAVGISAAISSAIAWLPGPIIGGKIIDSACLIWNKSVTTSTSYCAFYDLGKLRFRIHGLMVGIRVLATIFLLLGLLRTRVLKRWRNGDEDLSEGTTPEQTEMQSLNKDNTDSN